MTDDLIIQAVFDGDIDEVRTLIQAGADVNARSIDHGTTPLMQAAADGRMDLVDLLLASGADPMEYDENGNTALHEAVFHDHVDIARLTIASGAIVSGYEAGEPMMMAALRGHVDCVRLFLDAGVDVDFVDIDGSTALTSAAANGHVDLIRFLVDRGANCQLRTPHPATRDSKTAREVALHYRHSAAAAALKDAGG